MKKIYSFMLLVLLVETASSQSPASPDSTFGNNGSVTLPAPMYPLPQVKSKHVLQPDGKIIICSNSYHTFDSSAIMLARFEADGTLDSSFGSNGVFNHYIFSGFNLAVGLELQPDGKIVASGICDEWSTGLNETFIMRLNENGSPDSSFGKGGFSHWNFSPDEERVTDMKRMIDGSFIIGGIIVSSVASDSGYMVKITPAGTLDSSFADNGLFRYQRNDNQTDLYSVEVMPDKSVICGGSTYTSGGTYQNVFIVKVDSTGSLYPGFANGGVFTKDLFSDYDEIHSLKLLPDGNILAAGYSYDDINTFNDGSFVLKLDSSGVPVNDFGKKAVFFFGNSNGPNRSYDMAVQADGKIVLAGEYFNTTTFTNDLMVLRVTDDGHRDTAFNNSKTYVVKDFNDGYDESSSVLIQPDGKILVYGTTVLDQNTQEVIPALVRFAGGESGGTLPLKMLSFTGTSGNETIALKWTTSHEVNTAYFTVQKSNNGISFHDIGKVVAKSDPTRLNEYSYTDLDTRTANAYYRLRITDKDGKTDYSKILLFSAARKDIVVYPTVTRSSITIQSNRREMFYLYGSTGQLAAMLTTGSNDIGNLAPGVYYLKTADKVVKIIRQ